MYSEFREGSKTTLANQNTLKSPYLIILSFIWLLFPLGMKFMMWMSAHSMSTSLSFTNYLY